MTSWVLPVGVLCAEVERRRGQLGLTVADVATAARVPVSTLDSMAAGMTPDQPDAGLLLLWLGWQPDMARYVVGDAA